MDTDLENKQDVRNLSLGTSILLSIASLAIFIWQYVITRMLLENPHGSMDMYYYGRAILALLVAIMFVKIVAPNNQTKENCLSILFALVAGISPFILWLFPTHVFIAHTSCLAAGAASSWLYLLIFRMYANMPLRSAMTQLLGALALSYLLRIAWGFVASIPLLVIGFITPIACVGIASYGTRLYDEQRLKHHSNSGPAMSQGPQWSNRLFWLFVIEFAVYGCVAGLIRTPYENAQFDLPVNEFGGSLLFLCTLLFLWWARHKDNNVHLNAICQVVLLLLLTVLLTLVLFGDVNSTAAAIASLFARFGVYTLLLYVSCVFVSQRKMHPYVTFGFAWGFFTFATGIGMTVANMVGISKFSAFIALGIAYILVVVSLIAAMKIRGDDLLFSVEGDIKNHVNDQIDMAEQLFEDIAYRCEQIGVTYGLTKRETEVMQLICLGRSKSHIAEEFGITENTVRGYAKNVYRKLGIHSRQDLLTLVGIQ